MMRSSDYGESAAGAMVLCYLEGMSLEGAAGQLGCPIGTLGVRLMRATERLKSRLARRNVNAGGRPRRERYPRESDRPSDALSSPLFRSTLEAVMNSATGGIASLAAANSHAQL